VGASLAIGDLVVTNVTRGAQPTPASVAFDTGSRTATWTFAAPLSDGNYEVLLPKSGVSNPSGNSPQADFRFRFQNHSTDLNGDHVVNDADLYLMWVRVQLGQAPAADLDRVRSNYLLNLGAPTTDANGDGVTNDGDLYMVWANERLPLLEQDPSADLNYDGVVDQVDVDLVMSGYNTSSPAGSLWLSTAFDPWSDPTDDGWMKQDSSDEESLLKIELNIEESTTLLSEEV
jgi:hypothetical protein